MKKIIFLLILTTSLLIASDTEEYVDFTAKEPVIRSGLKEAKRNIKTDFVYNPNDMFRVYAREGFLTTILLNADEKIIYLAGGDTARWAIDEGVVGTKDGNKTIVVVKPFYEGLKTNLIINTTKRSYNILLHSAVDWYNPIVAFLYPNEKLGSFLAKEDQETKINIADINFKYDWNNKKYNFAPKMVYDDGKKTFFKMSEKFKTGEAPALFAKDEQTGDIVNVNFRYNPETNIYIIDRLLKQAVLIVGKKEIIIKRKGSFIKNSKDHYPVGR